MKRRSLIAALVFAAGAASCDDRAEPIAPPLSPGATFLLVDHYGMNPTVPFASGITVFVQRTEYTTQVDAAWQAWNSAWEGSDATPVFSTRSGTDTLEVNFSGTGSYFCGAGWEGSVQITRQPNPTPACGGGRPGEPYSDLTNLIKHEFGHAVGYVSLDYWPVGTDGCVMNAPASGNPLNNDMCNHEKQLAFWRYGERDTLDLNSALIDDFADDFELEVDSLDVGDTTWVRLYFSQTPDTASVVSPAEPPEWWIDDTNIAEIVDQEGDSVQITAVAGCATTLHVEIGPDLHVNWYDSGPIEASATINVRGCPAAPVPFFTVESTRVWQNTDQYLNAGGSDQGANIRYSWQFSSGGGWTSPSADTLYDFQGHGSVGAPTITLKVSDTSTGRDSIFSRVVTVSSGSITVSGQTEIWIKAKYPYTSNHSSRWLERYPPSLDWTLQVQNKTDSIGRIWPGGEYDVDLRAQDSVVVWGDTALARGLLNITVCTVTQSCMYRMAGGTTQASGPLFGGGPVLTWTESGERQALQFYQLMGAHSVAGPFTGREWFDEANGSASNDPWPGSVAWRRAVSANAVVYTFDIDPPTAGEYVFGFSLDPDLGGNVADDLSGHDFASGMVYVSDATSAMGFMLRSAGKNALAAAVQYGTNRFAPPRADLVWVAHQQGGIDLLPGPSDVQFLLGATPVSGKSSYELLMVEADNVKDLIAKARAIR